MSKLLELMPPVKHLLIYWLVFLGFLVFGCGIEHRQAEPFDVNVLHSVDIPGVNAFFRQECIKELGLEYVETLEPVDEGDIEVCVGEKYVELIEDLSQGVSPNVPASLIVK